MPLSRPLAAAGALLAALFGAPAANACTISVVSVNFGAYDPNVSTPDDSAGSVTLDCHKNQKSASVSITAGGSGSFAERRMTGGGSNLDYNLYTNASRTIVWGNGTSGTATVSVGAGSTTLPIYGRITARQNVRAGSYSDATVVTVTF